MNELKTLKDIEKYMWNEEEYDNMNMTPKEYNNSSKTNQAKLLRDDSVKIDDLKQEAIKWIERHRVMGMRTHLVEAWIEHFFNLTEEDLK